MEKVVAPLFAIFFPIAISSADELTLREGVSGYEGTLDTTILSPSPDDAFGSIGEVQVDSDQAGNSGAGPAQGLLRFANLFGDGPNQVPFGAVISSATLRLNTNNVSTNSFTAHRMLVAWDETSTWNALGNNGITPGVDALSTATATFTPGSFGSIDLDVKIDVAAWASGDENYGWGFVTSGTNGWDFDSSEASAALRPQLIITFVSEPSPPIVENVIITPAGPTTPAGFAATISGGPSNGSVLLKGSYDLTGSIATWETLSTISLDGAGSATVNVSATASSIGTSRYFFSLGYP